MLKKSWPRQTSIDNSIFVSLVDILQTNNGGVLSAVQVETVTWTLCAEVSWDSSEPENSVLVTVPIRLNHLSHTEDGLLIFI
jgi:hypothetical protein